jgi:hypothetical protein
MPKEKRWDQKLSYSEFGGEGGEVQRAAIPARGLKNCPPERFPVLIPDKGQAVRVSADGSWVPQGDFLGGGQNSLHLLFHPLNFRKIKMVFLHTAREQGQHVNDGHQRRDQIIERVPQTLQKIADFVIPDHSQPPPNFNVDILRVLWLFTGILKSGIH